MGCRKSLPPHKSSQTTYRYGQGDEGNEEEEREQDCEGPHGQGNGAPWQQGKNHWRLDCQGFDQEQSRQDCEQEAERTRQEVPMDAGCQEGAHGPEAQGIRRDQEGLTPLRQGEGVLQCVSAALSTGEASEAPAPAVGISAVVERWSPSFYQLQ